MPPVIILGVLVVLVLVAGIFLLRGDGSDDIDERLEQLSQFTSEFLPEGGESEEQRTARDRLMEQADKLANRGRLGDGLRAQLRKANMKLTVGEYLMMHGVTFVLGGLIGFIIWRSLVLAVVASIAGLFAPRIYLGMQRAKRLKAFQNQLADILTLWVNALRSGYSVMQSLEAISREAPPPASEEFRRIVLEAQIGIPIEDALDNMLARIESEDLDMVFTAVKVQREVGGNLAEILDTISDTIRQRVRIKGEIATLTAQGRITGYVISGLPILLSFFLYAINKPYMERLLKGPPWIIPDVIPCGWPIVCGGVVMIAVGATIISRIVDIEV